MHRRDFLLRGGASAILVCIHPELGMRIGPEAADAAQGEQLQQDVRLQVLRSAILAPNSHNTQPWKIELLAGNRMNLYVDSARILPETDPWARQTFISHGAFLELLEIAAKQIGYTAKIHSFPEGEPDPHELKEKPVATIDLQTQPDVQPDPLFAGIANRQSNKRCYEPSKPIAQSELSVLEVAAATTYAEQWMEWRWVSGSSEKKALAEICRQAMAIEVASRQRNQETAAWFRFSERELRNRRDGFGCGQSGLGGVERWIAESFLLSRERAANPQGNFARGAIEQAGKQANSAASFGALVSHGNSRMQQLCTGRLYARMHLAATCRGIAIHPMSQALEEYGEMAAMRQRLKSVLDVNEQDTVQMFFRLGSAPSVPRPPRRKVEDLIRQSTAEEIKAQGAEKIEFEG